MANNCIVAQSGGPTAAINASLAGVIKGVIDSKQYDKLYGAVHGIQGVLKKNFLLLSDSSEDFIKSLISTPAMYLGSCRFKLPHYEEDKKPYEEIFKIFEELEVSAFFYIGGNDSMDTVDKLSAYAEFIGSDVKIAGIPKTIDNDLLVTDHTPGFGSAAKYVASSIREIAYDTYIYDLESITIVEVMGRDAGWLTAASALARNEFSGAPHLIYLPEKSFSRTAFIDDLKKLLASDTKNIIVAVSEGLKDESGKYLAAGAAAADKFGHAQLSGAGKYLEYLVKEELKTKVRSVEINVLQRCAGHLASRTDHEEAFALGSNAVNFVLEGKTGFMTVIKRLSNSPYSYDISYVPVGDVANKAKAVPDEYINAEGNDVTSGMLEYLTPLVQGDVQVEYENGIVSYLPIEHLTNLK